MSGSSLDRPLFYPRKRRFLFRESSHNRPLSVRKGGYNTLTTKKSGRDPRRKDDTVNKFDWTMHTGNSKEAADPKAERTESCEAAGTDHSSFFIDSTGINLSDMGSTGGGGGFGGDPARGPRRGGRMQEIIRKQGRHDRCLFCCSGRDSAARSGLPGRSRISRFSSGRFSGSTVPGAR